MRFGKNLLIFFCVVAVLLASNCVFAAGTIYREYAQACERGQLDDETGAEVALGDLPADIRITRDVAYGADVHHFPLYDRAFGK